MTPFSINGKVVYINDITKILFMSDDEFNEEYKDLIARDIAEDIENPFASPSCTTEPNEEYLGDEEDFDILKEEITSKMS